MEPNTRRQEPAQHNIACGGVGGWGGSTGKRIPSPKAGVVLKANWFASGTCAGATKAKADAPKPCWREAPSFWKPSSGCGWLQLRPWPASPPSQPKAKVGSTTLWACRPQGRVKKIALPFCLRFFASAALHSRSVRDVRQGLSHKEVQNSKHNHAGRMSQEDPDSRFLKSCHK